MSYGRLAPLLLLFILILPLATAVTLTRYEANTTAVSSGYAVYAGQTLAQSFTATENYTIARVVLRVRDVGADEPLYVRLVADRGGIPGGNAEDDLARASNNSGNTYVWVNFDLTPNVKLKRGSIYWIVANNSAINNAEGYGWDRSGSNTYADGHIAYNQGTGWFLLTSEDLTFENYGYVDAEIRLAMVANRTAARVGDLVNYTVHMNNTGGEAASWVWLNITLPPQAVYVSDSNSSLGGIRTGDFNWTFANLTPGPHSFQLQLRVVGGVGGESVVVRGDVDYTGVLGARFDGSPASGAFTIQGPRVSGALTVAPIFPRRGDNMTFQVYVNNTGNEGAAILWLNHTLPSTGVFLADTANATGFVTGWSLSGDLLNITMANISVGSHSFTVSVGQQGGLPGGTEFALEVRWAYTDASGNQFPSGSTRATAILKGPRVSLSLGADRSFATPGDAVRLRLDYSNLGSGITLAQDLYLNLTLDPSATLRNATEGYNATVASTGVLSWYFPTLAAGGSGTLWANISLPSTLVDGLLLNFTAAASFEDDLGIRMPEVYSNLTLTSRAPVFSPTVPGNLPDAEAGEVVNYLLRFDNLGSGLAKRVWVNVSLGQGLAFTGFDINMSSGLLVNFHPSSRQLRFVFANVAPGPQLLAVQVAPLAGLADGAQLSLDSTLDYQDVNGNRRAASAPPAQTFSVLAPRLVASLSLSPTSAGPGDALEFEITVANQGRSPAQGYWVNLTLDASLVAGEDTSGVGRTELGPKLSWHLVDLGPGEERRFTLAVSVGDPGAQDRVLSFILTADYADRQGGSLAQARSDSVTLLLPAAVQRTPTLQEFLPALAVASALAIAIALVVRRVREPSVTEVFLVHREGLLMASASRGGVRGKDRDILAGSLVAVQDFIKEAFAQEAKKDLDRLDLGNYKILIRRGRGVFLVVALLGTPTRRTVARVGEALRQLEAEYGRRLEEWNGNMEEMEGVQKFLHTWLDSSAKGRKRAAP